MKGDATKTILCFQAEEYEMPADEPAQTCGGCGHLRLYDEGCDNHPGSCGFCPVWDHVRADEPQQTAGPDENPCERWTPREEGKDG